MLILNQNGYKFFHSSLNKAYMGINNVYIDNNKTIVLHKKQKNMLRLAR